MNGVTVNLSVLFAFFSLLHITLRDIPQWDDWVKVYEHFYSSLYIARLISRGDGWFSKVPSKTMGPAEIVA